jgi:RecA-family ATPase
MDEMHRRVLAICQHYNIPQEELEGRLFLTTGSEIPLKVAKGYNELQLDNRLIKDITENIMDNKIDVAMFDPLISLHGTRESDNDKMDAVIRVFLGIGQRANCSINLSHHTRKTPAGSSDNDRTGDDGRGASAVRDAVRGMRVLNPMSATDAAKIGVNELQRTLHFRIDRGKANYAPPAKSAVWRKFESVTLPNGDDVGVVTPWQFPDDGVLDFTEGAQEDNLLFLVILDRFTAQGRWVNPTSGPTYAPHAFAKEPEARAAGATKHRLTAAMRRLFAAKHIRVEEYRTTHNRPGGRIVRSNR